MLSPLWLPVLAGRRERGLEGAVCRDAGAGGAEGGSPPPGAAQCGGSFQPVSGRRGAAGGAAAAESRARWGRRGGCGDADGLGAAPTGRGARPASASEAQGCPQRARPSGAPGPGLPAPVAHVRSPSTRGKPQASCPSVTASPFHQKDPVSRRKALQTRASVPPKGVTETLVSAPGRAVVLTCESF